jgi:RNA polymerase sigma factor (TIGR02999 family)
MAQPVSITQLLNDLPNNKTMASARIAPMVFSELHRLAQSYMSREQSGHTLQATGLVNEAFVNLIEKDLDWNNRAHFYAIAAQQMRRILVDHARKKASQKRGAEYIFKTFSDTCTIGDDSKAEELIIVDDLLSKLSQQDEATGTVFELRYFGGLTVKEISLMRGTSESTIEREIRFAKAWIGKHLLIA